jgi:hypothetical protein
MDEYSAEVWTTHHPIETDPANFEKRICKKPRNVFYDSIIGIFPKSVADLEFDDKMRTILAPDITEEAAKKQSATPEGKSPSQKRRYFLQYFIPFLQDKLARVLVEDTVTSAVGFNDQVVARTMLENIAISRKKSPVTAMDFLLNNLKQPDSDTPGRWSGYLAPLSSDSYVFSVSSDTQPPPFVLDGEIMQFLLQQEEPQRLWSTMSAPVKLDSGKLYSLDLFNIQPDVLQWKATAGSRTLIPGSSFLPNRAESELKGIFMSLQKLAIVINNFKFSADDLVYIYNHPDDFDQIDFMHLTVAQWKRLQQFVSFRNSLPRKREMTLLELFTWAENNPDAEKDELANQIARSTLWKKLQVSQILDHISFKTLGSCKASSFKSEVILAKIAQLIGISTKLGVDIPRLFSWATPLGTSPTDFFKLRDISQDIQKVARSRYNLSTWPDVVKPLNDILRENQKNALISYLLVQDEIKTLGIRDADGLFEYFLIDPQMTPLVETSRIKQAVATVQVYVQRCLLGLEAPYGVRPTVLNRPRWDWMQKYRSWEANRKVFLYPENWIDPSLRDNKSEFFKTLESELLQKDLSKEIVSEALKSFLYNVSGISNMTVVGLCVDGTNVLSTIHLFARTKTAPYSYYHNVYTQGNWADWKKMAIEVPHYTVDDAKPGKVAASGVYFAPYAFDNRVIVFIPQIMKKTLAPEIDDTQSFTTLSGKVSNTKPMTAWEIKMSWTELRNGAWTPRQLCPDGVIDIGAIDIPQFFESMNLSKDAQFPASIDSFVFIPGVAIPNDSPGKSSTRLVKVWVGRKIFSRISFDIVLAEWHFTAGQLSLGSTYNRENWMSNFNLTFPQSSFSYDAWNNQIHSMQASESGGAKNFDFILGEPYSTAANPASSSWGSDFKGLPGSEPQPMYHGRINELMSQSMDKSAGNNMPLYSYLGSMSETANSKDLKAMFGGITLEDGSLSFNEVSQPFSLYNWELGLHAPMLLIDRLLKAQQFEQALEVCHYVFNPMANGPREDMTRFWVFAPFKFVKGQTIESYFQSFKAGEERCLFGHLYLPD